MYYDQRVDIIPIFNKIKIKLLIFLFLLKKNSKVICLVLELDGSYVLYTVDVPPHKESPINFLSFLPQPASKKKPNTQTQFIQCVKIVMVLAIRGKFDRI